MKLSIIIVNYNVKHFLDQLLQSIQKSDCNFEYEIIVVDNNSADGSVPYLQNKYPEVLFIANKKNLGFSAANNQGITRAKGEYILLLNPDTLLRQDSLSKCIDYMDAHADTGAVGVKMIDGSGRFLPESKRGLPTPSVSFFKMTGLYKYFPKSKVFNAYYQGHIAENEVAEIDVLTGAFFLTRHSILKKIGGLDESYFMYGEDIDLSYRIKKLGYKIIYFPKTQIVHYKGESSKALSFKRYVAFYHSMLLFAQKHFSKGWGGAKRTLVYGSIIFSAVMAFVLRHLLNALPWIFEGLLIFFGIVYIKEFWGWFVHGDIAYYPKAFNSFNAPLYSLIWLLMFYLFGNYDNFPRFGKNFIGALVGLAIVLMVYALLPEQLRSSRPIIFLSFVWVLFSSFVLRNFWSKLTTGQWLFGSGKNKRVLVFGTPNEIHRARELLADYNLEYSEVIDLPYHDTEHIEQVVFKIKRSLLDHKMNEIIICSKGVGFDLIISLIEKINFPVRYNILSENGSSFVASPSSNKPGKIHSIDVQYQIANPYKKRMKRFFDLIVALFLLLFFPLLLFLFFSKSLGPKNYFAVLLGHSTWVGYDQRDRQLYKLPELKPAVYSIASKLSEPSAIHLANRRYAKYYNLTDDIAVLLKRK